VVNVSCYYVSEVPSSNPVFAILMAKMRFCFGLFAPLLGGSVESCTALYSWDQAVVLGLSVALCGSCTMKLWFADVKLLMMEDTLSSLMGV
jgi:hypothetical protein